MKRRLDRKQEYAANRLRQAGDARDWALSELRSAVIDAFRLGLTKAEIHQSSGVSRPTINKWLAEYEALNAVVEVGEEKSVYDF